MAAPTGSWPTSVYEMSPCGLLKLGSGSSAKTDLLLTALHHAGGRHYAALEISEPALTGAIERLGERHPGPSIDGCVGDFHHDLVKAVAELVPAYVDMRRGHGRVQPQRPRLIKRELDGALPIGRFAHRAVRIPAAIDLTPSFRAGDHIVTRHFHKHRIDQLRRELSVTGRRIRQVVTDERDRVAVLLAPPV